MKKYTQSKELEIDIVHFDVDIWLLTIAMVNKVKLAQANLNVETHKIKEPKETMGQKLQ